jgi:hypothetical protein
VRGIQPATEEGQPMTPEIAKMLRAPFAADEIGKKPKLTCGECRNSPTKACKEHKKSRCAECRNFITSAHMHIDYVGHAETTDRFLAVDPEWYWEPLAWAADGSPLSDAFGGMWIKLSIAGVTRIGYGHPDGKRGGDAIKETIGDALRNAGMRFGVGLDLWGAKFENAVEEQPRRRRKNEPTPDPAAAGDDPAGPQRGERDIHPAMVTQQHHKTMHALWNELGYGGNEHRETRLQITAKLLGLTDLQTSSALTAAQAEHVIGKLRDRISQTGAGA